ncbi:DUF1697 domain-containing protein [Agromyces sp. Marseille-Q5079]|uniref:DUF1697 domain-containing protein n=1 Tax=Agromyces sp. Marseille-Q5079 TaxID=3439059 RepID=UPI003D9C8202
MATHIALLRGINVGGRNPVAMSALADTFVGAGYADVSTYMQSGNVLFTTDAASGTELETSVERMLEQRFGVSILTVVRSRDELAATVAAAPPDHGSDALRSEVFFLKHPLTADEAMAEMPELRDGVDSASAGPGALYFSRVAARATKTRIQRFMGTPVFQRMTVRTWKVTTRLLQLADA